jgi:hypothetical protein
MRRTAISAVSVLGATLALGVTAVPALAQNDTPGQKISSSTTLDACGYFVGTQTANKTNVSGTLHSENGTWTGVSNNYVFTPVASLGTVTGSYTESSNHNLDGTITDGTEVFRSNAGQITQSFSRDPSMTWHVSVTATGSLSFLTSDTETSGDCYSGTFPRP